MPKRPEPRERPPEPFYETLSPVSYPSHDYTGKGRVATIITGTDTAGVLTHKGDSVMFLPKATKSASATLAKEIISELRGLAGAGIPASKAFDMILEDVPHTGVDVANLTRVRS